MSREYLETLLENDGENWVMYTREWMIYWSDLIDNKDGVDLIIHPSTNGFVLFDTDHILFAFVSSSYRRKGVLKDMMKIVKDLYKIEITLSSLDTVTDKVWEYFGFVVTELREDDTYCSLYLLDNTLDK